MSIKNRTPSQMTTQQPQLQPSTPSNNHPFLSSDSEDDCVPLSQPLPPVIPSNLNDLLTDDETDGEAKPRSTTTSKTSVSYKTCNTKLEYKIEISEDDSDDNEVTLIQKFVSHRIEVSEEDSDDDVQVVQQSPATLTKKAITPTVAVSSTDKVKSWLKKIPSPEASPKVAKRLEMTRPPAEPVTGSQTSTSSYPFSGPTEGRSRFSSLGATSRLESSPDSPRFESALSQPISSQASQEAENNRKNSLFYSQGSGTSRSSSFYFKDSAPWSKSGTQQTKTKKKKKPVPPKYSDVSEWSDAKSHLSSQKVSGQSGEESLRLYLEPSNEQVEEEENFFRACVEIEEEAARKVPAKRKSSRTTTSSSAADTWERMSYVFASSEQFVSRPKPLHDLTNNFNPALSSTQRDSVFNFPSYNEDEKNALADTMIKTPPRGKDSDDDDSPDPQTVRKLHGIINLSSDDENGHTPSTQKPEVVLDSDEDQESPQRIVRRPNRASYLELVASDSENEDAKEPSVIPETDEEEGDSDGAPQQQEKEESESQATHFTQADHENIQKQRLDFMSEESEEDLVPDSQGPEKEIDLPVKPSPQRARASIISPAQHRSRYISSESEDDTALEEFFKKQRELRQKKEKTPDKSSSKDDSFIVPDDVVELDSDEEDDDDKAFSPSFYLKVINDRRRADDQIDLSIKDGNLNIIRKQFTQTPTPTKGKRNMGETEPRQRPKPKVQERADHSPYLGFLASLSTTDHPRCDPAAVPFLKKYNSKKDDLVEHLFQLFNQTVFENKLDEEMSITWNNRLRSTAGFCYNQRKKIAENDTIRISRIELSGKILKNAAQLRDTLIHELCHAATWVIDGTLGGHGPVWKKWTRRAKRLHPELPEVKRCHNYTIETKYTYQCIKCTYSFGRHSKSLDLERKVCGICRGRFQLIINGKKAESADATPRKLNAFATFVQENYKFVRQKDVAHKDAMRLLSQRFQEAKIKNA